MPLMILVVQINLPCPLFAFRDNPVGDELGAVNKKVNNMTIHGLALRNIGCQTKSLWV